MDTPPRWDLSNVYPSLESRELEAATKSLENQLDFLDEFFSERIASVDVTLPAVNVAALLGEAIEHLNKIYELNNTIFAYINAFVSVDSRNELARKKRSEHERLNTYTSRLFKQFQAWVGEIAPLLEQMLPLNATVQAHAFNLMEIAEQAKYLMSGAEESLATELSLSGDRAWSKLQSTITSQMSVDFKLDGELQKLPIPALINLYFHPNESVRRRAYETELQVWNSVREPLAACLNGIKGTANTLNHRRGRKDALHVAIDSARIDHSTLEAMLGAIQSSLPMFGKYLKTKARRLGKEKLAWWDLFAPLGENERAYSFHDAQQIIVEHFGSFSTKLSAFAERAFENHWIDAEQRQGKRGGAFCTSLPGVKESRVLCNFGGTLDQVLTIAHELGHAYHNECAYRANKTEFQQVTPMTLAETASIMCEMIIMDAILTRTSSPQEELAIRETRLLSDTQTIVDIYSRYLFEKEVFERREKAELSVEELCDIMECAQKAAYGDALDQNYLHKYMWTWKPHYYYPHLPFYNFPYAFGLLFSIGLYEIYQQRGASFVPDYEDLLANTGDGMCADLTARFGIDIHSAKFWEDSLAVIGENIEHYCAL